MGKTLAVHAHKNVCIVTESPVCPGALCLGKGDNQLYMCVASDMLGWYTANPESSMFLTVRVTLEALGQPFKAAELINIQTQATLES